VNFTLNFKNESGLPKLNLHGPNGAKPGPEWDHGLNVGSPLVWAAH